MISAVVLAAGRSKRMGQPKMLLSWGGSTVLQTVIGTLRATGLEDILVVTGAGHAEIEALVGASAQTVFNPLHEQGEMLSSIQTGLASLAARQGKTEAALIALGDQPQMEARTVLDILEAYRQAQAALIVPSHENRRGHPWLVAAAHWEEIAAFRAPASMRDFFHSHSPDIHYIQAANASVLADLDTPEDYRKYRP